MAGLKIVKLKVHLQKEEILHQVDLDIQEGEVHSASWRIRLWKDDAVKNYCRIIGSKGRGHLVEW